jgi:hypothetical protein
MLMRRIPALRNAAPVRNAFTGAERGTRFINRGSKIVSTRTARSPRPKRQGARTISMTRPNDIPRMAARMER